MRYSVDRKKSLAFCANVKHAKDLAECFNQNGIKAKAIYGAMDDDERASTLSGFSSGNYAVLTNCQLLTEGFDEPSIDCVIMGRPTQSTALFTQMIGRGTRTFPQKQDCLVLDFTDNASKHTLCTYKNTLDGAVAALFELESKEDRDLDIESSNDKTDLLTPSKAFSILEKYVDDIEFFDKAQFTWTPNGDTWHLHLAVNRDVWVRKVEGGCLVAACNGKEFTNLSNMPIPMDYAIGVAEDWARKQTTKGAINRQDAPWKREPATEKQIETMQKCGINFDIGVTKGEAYQLLANRFGEPPTPKQTWWLRHHGALPNHPITKLEAQKIISRLKRC